MTLWSLRHFSNISNFIIFTFFIPLLSVTTANEFRLGSEFVPTAAQSCDPVHQRVKNFTFEDHRSSPPAEVTLTQRYNASKPCDELRIYVTATEVREDFHIWLIANPYVKKKADCHPLNQTDNDINNLSIYVGSCRVLKNDSKTRNRFFHWIFTGCYHFVMTNSEGKQWQHPPVFYNGTYRYPDTLLKPKEFKFKPENTNSSMRLKAWVEVPSDCIEVRVAFWELDKNIKNPMTDIKLNKILSKLECTVSIKGEEIVVSNLSNTSTSITNLTLEGRLVRKHGNGWTGILEWSNLKSGGWQYYLYFYASNLKECKRTDCEIVTTDWEIINKNIYVELGYTNLNNAPFLTPGTFDFPWFFTSCGLICAIIVVIINYWIKRYVNLFLLWGYGNKNECIPSKEPVTPLKEKDCDQILLIYESGSDLFMKEMEDLRHDLEQRCSGFNIHDVWAINEWNRARQLTGPGWVEDLLERDSKIVWVDTPQFRSRLNDKQRRYTKDDFRDDVVPHAFTTTMDSFPNSNTQYRRHFILRLNGVDVQDGDDDPLQVLSSHARYYLPKQFDRLCNDLVGSKTNGKENS